MQLQCWCCITRRLTIHCFGWRFCGSVEFSVSFLFLFLLLLLLHCLTNLLFYFKSFKLKMQVALCDKNVSPLDATLESVMPGVHQPFMAMKGHVKRLDCGMSSCFDKLETIFQDSLRSLQEYNQGRNVQHAENLRMMTARLDLPASPTL
jgi:hypothetical protein